MDNLVALGLLTLLQAVLGLDNLLSIVFETKRAPEGRRSKATFYFVIAVLILTDVAQSRYRRRLMRLRGVG